MGFTSFSYRHFPAKALGRQLCRVKGLDLCIVEQVPAREEKAVVTSAHSAAAAGSETPPPFLLTTCCSCRRGD